MNKAKASEDSILPETKTTKKRYFRVFFLLLNTLVWWYVALGIVGILSDNIQATEVQNLGLLTTFYVSTISSGIVGSFLSRGRSRDHIIYYWMGLGVIASLSPALLNTSFAQVLGACLFLGSSFGIGIPSSLAYFAEHTSIEARGRGGGTIFFFANVSAPLFYVSFGILDLAMGSVGLALWRGLGIIAFFLSGSSEPASSKEKRKTPFRSLFKNRAFVLYLLAWSMFCFVDRLNEPVLRNSFGENITSLIVTTAPFISGASAFVGGLLCDWIGRKRIVIYGFISMGISYALIGIFPENPISGYFYAAVDGVAWGLFMVAFVLIIWGDLAPTGLVEAYYMIGSIPFFVTDLTKIAAAPYVTQIPEYATFSLATFLLFFAVLPLMYAPETLPEKKIELRRLRKYVQKAKKISEEYSGENAEN